MRDVIYSSVQQRHPGLDASSFVWNRYDHGAGLRFHQVITPSYPLFREPQYLLSLANRIVQVFTIVGSDPSYSEIVAFSIEQSDGVTAVSNSLRESTYRQPRHQVGHSRHSELRGLSRTSPSRGARAAAALRR